MRPGQNVSTKTVIASAEEIKETEVTKDLELLADFVVHVTVSRVELRERVRV
jgi:hypothetical protein